MPTRTKSIFHLGEEGGEEANKSKVAIRGVPESLVGLRVLIQHHRRGSNIVIRSALKMYEPSARAQRSPMSLPELGFLKACFFCKRELSLQKDVYMYRGDQGFCSVECRCQQILLDERKEFEASTRERLALPPPRHASSKIQESDRRRRISVAA